MGMASLNNAVLSAKHLNNDHGTPHAPKLRNRPHNQAMGHNEKLRRSLGMVLSVYNIHSCFGILLSCFAFTSFACLVSLASVFSSASNPTPPLELNILICDKTGSREPQVMQFTLDWTSLSPHSKNLKIHMAARAGNIALGAGVGPEWFARVFGGYVAWTSRNISDTLSKTIDSYWTKFKAKTQHFPYQRYTPED